LSGQQTILLDRYNVPRAHPFSFTCPKTCRNIWLYPP